MVAYNHKAQCSLYCARICVDRRLKAQKLLALRSEGPRPCPVLKAGVVREGWERGVDEPDAPLEGLPYSNFDVLVTIYSIITYVLDFGSDFWVAYYHYLRAVEAEEVRGKWWKKTNSYLLKTPEIRLHWIKRQGCQSPKGRVVIDTRCPALRES